MIMQMYSEWYKPQEIGEALGVSEISSGASFMATMLISEKAGSI